MDQAVGSADLLVVVALELVQADHVGSTLELELLLEVLDAEELELEDDQTAHVSEDELALVLLEAELEEVEVFTDGVETTQTWVEVTVGAQLAGSTQVFQPSV